MEPIYGRTGQVVAWLHGEDVISLAGGYDAFISSGSVISYRGKHLGWFEHGAFWNSQNQAVGMLRDLTASIPRPGLGGVPGRPGLRGRPGRPGLPGTPGKDGRSNSWANQDWATWMS